MIDEEPKKTGNMGKGRPKGSRNRDTLQAEEKLKKYSHDPIKGMVLIAKNELPCSRCRGKLRTNYILPEGKHAAGCWLNMAHPANEPEGECSCEGIGERPCASCCGTGLDTCSPALRGQMNAELAGYIHSKRKAIEVSGDGGGPVQIALEVKFVD